MIDPELMQILEKIYQARGFDFRQYKESNLKRRIERRLRTTKTTSYQEYTKLLDTDAQEYKRLIDDLTIKVTEFFRDSEAWQVIRQKILPQIIEQKVEERQEKQDVKPVLRIWCAGCATGQEVYSLAIVLDQLLEERKDKIKIDIWGTDIDKESLLKAQEAEYNVKMIEGLSQDILDKYFNFNGNFRIKSFLGEGIQFKFQDLVLDEPLRKMNLILCRNVAIYFGSSLQEKVFIDFYKSLDKEGYLFLGKAETLIGPAQEKFKTVDKRWRIYQRRE